MEFVEVYGCSAGFSWVENADLDMRFLDSYGTIFHCSESMGNRCGYIFEREDWTNFAIMSV